MKHFACNGKKVQWRETDKGESNPSPFWTKGVLHLITDDNNVDEAYFKGLLRRIRDKDFTGELSIDKIMRLYYEVDLEMEERSKEELVERDLEFTKLAKNEIELSKLPIKIGSTDAELYGELSDEEIALVTEVRDLLNKIK